MEGAMMYVVSLLASLAFQAAPARPVEVADGLVPPSPRTVAANNPNLSDETRGDIMMARKMYREAIDFYKLGAEKNAVLANKAGIAYHQLGDLDNAKKYYERAIKLDKNYAEAINNLGTVHYAKKSYNNAIRQYQKALAIEPGSASVWSNMGTAYFARKKYDEAFQCYAYALTLDPEVFERRGTNGVLLQERSIEEKAQYYYMLARTYAQAGIAERALQYMRFALENGFKDRKLFSEAPEFAFLKDSPEFQQLLTAEYQVL
jgi:tetratricopeptide (TPR) repeat protein